MITPTPSRRSANSKTAGVKTGDISLIANKAANRYDTYPDHPVDRVADRTEETAAGPGATIGAAVGGGVGLLAGLGIMAIPGVGPVVADGALVATLAGAAVGAAAGGRVGYWSIWVHRASMPTSTPRRCAAVALWSPRARRMRGTIA